jgi:hypothetical protein
MIAAFQRLLAVFRDQTQMMRAETLTRHCHRTTASAAVKKCSAARMIRHKGIVA